MKRLLTQIAFFTTTNAYIKGFIEGNIYKGQTKYACVPGLNCYSCPGALGSCPIGALQAVIGSAKYSIPFYAAGLLALFGVFLGRFICGWLCPFGLVQDLLYKIKVKKRALPVNLDGTLRYMKYAVLGITVILLPMVLTNSFGIAPPYFCQYICPSGTLFGGVPLLIADPHLRQAAGLLFGWKFSLLLLFLASSLLVYRPFCKYVCPLGAIYALFNRVSFYRMHIDSHRCNGCGNCEKSCPMQVPFRASPNHGECIRCGRCKKLCPTGAIR